MQTRRLDEEDIKGYKELDSLSPAEEEQLGIVEPVDLKINDD
jgi:hypothetical protein